MDMHMERRGWGGGGGGGGCQTCVSPSVILASCGL